jgi:hypothetical protein
MIPVSSSNYQQGCNPVSSNCVVWQGPDLPIIGLCNGDTVSDVIAKLAEKLVEISNSVSITGVDLSCLQLTTAPTTTEELFQVIVNEICSLGSRCTSLEDGSGSGATTSVTVASLPACLQYTNLENDLVTELPIDQYAELVASKVCTIIGDVTALQATVDGHETRITALENAPSSDYTTPQITPTCVLPANPTDIDVVLEELEVQFCTLDSTLGGSTELLSSSAAQCDTLASDAQLSGEGAMSLLPGWSVPVNTVAQSLTNMWLTICDMRAAIKDIKETCCTLSCTDIVFTFTGSYTSETLTLNFTGSNIPTALSECNVTGASVTVTDGTATFNSDVEVISALNTTNGIATISTAGSGLDLYADYTITVNLCVTDSTDLTCNKEKSITIINPDEEPAPSVNYYAVQACTNPGDIFVASITGTQLSVGQAVKVSHDGGAGCWTIIDTATGSANTTVLTSFADCTACQA